MNGICAKTPNDVVGEALLVIAERDPKLAVFYADCAERINIAELRERFPEVCYECGIAEQNMVSMAAAFANEGYTTFAIAYAPFITARVLDQVRVNLGYMKSPVTLVGLSSGFGGSDLGATHVAAEDIANMRDIPGLEVLSPCDNRELERALLWSARERRPRYLRVAIDGPGIDISPEERSSFPAPYVLKGGADVVIVGCGSLLREALAAAEGLDARGVSTAVVDASILKPFDLSAMGLPGDYQLVVSLEEHSVIGGLGGAIAEGFAGLETHPPLLRLGSPDAYGKADLPWNCVARYGLDAASIASSVATRLGALRAETAG